MHAAKAGARCTSVDMSRTYLNWGKDNFALNDLSEEYHQFIQADVTSWLAEDDGEYDLIFMDPPSFSNSKRMEGVLDIQRDHGTLIRDAMARLSEDGLLIFSCNLRKFQLDEDINAEFDVKNVSKKSVPQDFARRENIHVCYHIRRR